MCLPDRKSIRFRDLELNKCCADVIKVFEKYNIDRLERCEVRIRLRIYYNVHNEVVKNGVKK
jgi:hypothetical protein